MGLRARPVNSLIGACDLPCSNFVLVPGQAGCMQAAAGLVCRISPLLCCSMLAMVPHLHLFPGLCEEFT